MWPVIAAWARTYAPYIVMPLAGVVGFVGKIGLNIDVVKNTIF